MRLAKGLDGFRKHNRNFEADAEFAASAETNATDGTQWTRVKGASKAGPKIARSAAKISVKGKSDEYIEGSTSSSTTAEFETGRASS